MHAEGERLLATFGCEQVHRTFATFDSRFAMVHWSPEEVVAELTAGWQYLIDRDPRIMKWITAFQGPGACCPDYPGEGTPGGGYALGEGTPGSGYALGEGTPGGGHAPG